MHLFAAALAFLHALGWAAYVGGAVFMELVWRPAQEHIPPSQINVLCQRMGRNYRWLALTALGVVAATGVMLAVTSGEPLALTTAYGRTLALLALVWLGLVVDVSMMAVAAHPALHARTSSSMTDEERRAARDAVRRAIKRMDLLLRAELAGAILAVVLGTSLRYGGLF